MELGDFFRFLFKLGGSKDTLKRDIGFLKTRYQDLKKNLIPFSLHEAQLISYKTSNVSGKINGRNGTVGYIDTIYYENIMVFGAKTFHSDYTLIVAESTEDTFAFVLKNKILHVIMNDVEAGYINEKGVFYNKTKNPIAYWDWNVSSSTQHVEIMGRKVGIINNPQSSEVTTPRLFNLFTDPTEDEWSILLCLVLCKVVYNEK